jgi:RND family efflux transporter MFP subunit
MNKIPRPGPTIHPTHLPDLDQRPKAEEGRQGKDGKRRAAARLLGFAVAAIVTGLIGFGVWGKSGRNADADAVLQARLNAVPSVRTMIAKAEDTQRTIELTGNMAAFDSATLFARATGYISTRNVDIGSKVHKGDILAIIAAPDLDQQLAQAKAQLAQFEAAVQQAQATADLGQVTNQRTARLVAQGWSSQQQGDQDRLTAESRTAAVAVAKANVLAQQAAANRLEQLTQFEHITAPFDGVVTSRLIDVGSLVTADANSGTSLFSVARTDVLRVQVFVPQALSFGLKDGDPATVTVSELPGQVFHGKVARNAQALSAGSRTLLTEVDVDNKDGILAAGLYSVIHLQVRRPNAVITIPSQAVIFNQDGLKIAVVSEGKVELRKIDLEFDSGATVEIRAGLKAGERVILSPPANMADGMRVQEN